MLTAVGVPAKYGSAPMLSISVDMQTLIKNVLQLQQARDRRLRVTFVVSLNRHTCMVAVLLAVAYLLLTAPIFAVDFPFTDYAML